MLRKIPLINKVTKEEKEKFSNLLTKHTKIKKKKNLKMYILQITSLSQENLTLSTKKKINNSIDT